VPTLSNNWHIKKLLELLADPSIDVWSSDEVHFQLHGSRCSIWIPPEDLDPIYLHCPTRKSAGYFGAVRLRDGKFVYRHEKDRFNGPTFWTFMKDLRHRSSRAGRRVLVVVDNARYHRARIHLDWRQKAEPRFSLDFLPPYSPKLSVIERVWKLTRRLRIHNVMFSDVDGIAAAVERQFSQWDGPNETLRKLCAIT
jgi:transposase